MIRRPPRSTRTDTHFPYTARFRSGAKALFGEFDPQNVADAFRRIGGTPVFLRLVVVKQAKGNVGMGQRYAFQRVDAVAVFRGFRAQEFAARWNIVEKLANIDGGACRSGCGGWCRFDAADLPRVLGVGRARCDRGERKTVVEGKRGSVRVDLGGARI